MQASRILWPALSLAVVLSGCGKRDQAGPPAVAPTELAALQTPPPEYPPALACAGAGGRTVLKLTVGVHGSPTEVQLITSSGQPVLDESAQRAVRGWKFRPATRNGQPVEQTLQVPVDFRPPQPKPDECFALEERARRGG